MAYELKLPDLGEGVHEGEIIRWLVSEGDRVREDQPIVEVMTDKVTAEIPSPRAGVVLKISVEEGAVVPVGTSIITIVDGASVVSADAEPSELEVIPASATPEEERGAADRPGSVQGRGDGQQGLAMPAVRKLARELGVDLREIRASGAHVTKEEVRHHAEMRSASRSPSSSPSGNGGEGKTQERVPLRARRRRIAEHLVEAHRGTAPFTYVDEADFTELVSLRERVRPLVEPQGIHLTYLPFIITAVVAALKQHPWLNGRVDPETSDLVLSKEYHIGVAVETPDGLIVPVLRNAEQRGILDLAREVQRLRDSAHTGKLAPAEVQGSTFTITSLGSRGGIMATPIINTPEVGIIGVHRIGPRPVARDGAVVIRQMANVSLTFDHRYIDGALGADFAATLISYLQDPAMMMFWLSELRENRQPEPSG